MTITRLPEIVYPLTQVNKVNEIVDVLNQNLNMYYSEENPLLTSSEGACTWTVTHNLGTENVNCSLYNGDNLVISTVAITSENVVTVSLNSASNIAAKTYKIVIISNGAGSSSGGSSYTLPVATTSTLGGVKIDGTSITIDDGVISATATPITVDSSLSSTSTNPVQNKVITKYVQPSLSKYIPSGTVFNVKIDGTGDFTTLADAITYLNGKWSNGSVSIKLGDGTHYITSGISLYTQGLNIPELVIRGTNKSQCTIQLDSGVSTGLYVNLASANYLYLHDFTMVGSSISTGTGIIIQDGRASLTDCTFQSLGNGIVADWNADARIYNSTFSNCTTCIWANNGSSFQVGGTMNATSCDTILAVSNSGIIKTRTDSTTATVTRKTSQTINTITDQGLIIGSI